MRALAEAYPDSEFVQQAVALLPWGHNVRLLEAVKDPDERVWYIHQAVQHGWSRNVLIHQIESGLYRRQGKALTNFSRTLPAPQSELAQELIKDPYNFDFLTLGPEITEGDLERGLIDHVRDFILELGKGFAFLGSQYHLEVAGQDFFLDLLFYHVRLRCYVVIELKIEDFKPEFTGKMNFYLSVVDEQLRHEHDQPSIGIVLCKGKNNAIVEYALRDTNKPMGVAHYQLTPGEALPAAFRDELPTAAELAHEFPLMSLVRLRIEIERALAGLAVVHGLKRHRGIRSLLEELVRAKMLPNYPREFMEIIHTMDAAAHGVEVDQETADRTVEVGNRFLAALKSQL